MAVTYTVQDCYNVVCDVFLEPSNGGLDPGLSLGIVTQQNFLDLFAIALEDFINRTGLVWTIFTQQILFSTGQYLYPENLNDPKLAFVGGQLVEHLETQDLDDWQYGWRGKLGQPEYWHQDGLPPKTLEVAVAPNYNGASYVASTDPTAVPPFGVDGMFNGANPGQYTGTATLSSGTLTWATGSLFDMNWSLSYYPAPNISLGGAPYPIDTVSSTTTMTLIAFPADGTYSFAVNIGNDSNLTLVGTTGIASNTYTLDQIVPVVPDSFCPALAYGILARIFSADGESKDMQRSYFCQMKYMEYANLAAAVSGEMLAIDN